MAVVIRLARMGTKHKPKYRINVADQRRCLSGQYLETIGYYNPSPAGNEKGLEVDLTKAQEWIRRGAQPTDRVKALLKKAEAKA